jgi:hypothetical protein
MRAQTTTHHHARSVRRPFKMTVDKDFSATLFVIYVAFQRERKRERELY